ncbi:uncharacterized protein GGS22DRAFT_189433 [Annulohypoxylon maeteangense]|uniref:uncharacterized protein n=1 Tax=Annulohypoxylon maeteangense TaxID=1927788 RepID=UPI002007A627|nr:uncharacterized protein GGS22DRAFT_189433 [Annulohypoxylon maeteangense]KAI0884306.1 hypothetical protein GGS22DRAFT_189433 [Annulohypoxylon maeteangense]
MCFGEYPTESQRAQDEQLISELCGMVAAICFEGEMLRSSRVLQHRRIRLFYTDIKNEQGESQTENEQPCQSGPSMPKIPRNCDRCKIKALIISPVCIKKGGCAFK